MPSSTVLSYFIEIYGSLLTQSRFSDAGSVFGLLGARIVYDARHKWRDYGVPIQHSANVEVTEVSLVEKPTISTLRMPHHTEYQEYLLCLGLASVMPTHRW